MPDYHVAFWNLENLFDIENSPRRSEKLQRTLAGELAGWTRDVLDRKIQPLASIIRQMNHGSGPDLLGVCEVENRCWAVVRLAPYFHRKDRSPFEKLHARW